MRGTRAGDSFFFGVGDFFAFVAGDCLFFGVGDFFAFVAGDFLLFDNGDFEGLRVDVRVDARVDRRAREDGVCFFAGDFFGVGAISIASCIGFTALRLVFLDDPPFWETFLFGIIFSRPTCNKIHE